MNFAEQLKNQLNIVDVVGQYVRLKRSGAGPRYVGLCPFHSEKTPSFGVHSTLQFYKCFECEASGEGGTRRGYVTGSDPYGLTARTTVEGAIRCAAPGYDRSGALAPSQAFDPADFLDALGSAGVQYEAPPAAG